jgi:hypothetical protein
MSVSRILFPRDLLDRAAAANKAVIAFGYRGGLGGCEMFMPLGESTASIVYLFHSALARQMGVDEALAWAKDNAGQPGIKEGPGP